jgi:hypothetical protein
MPQLRGSSYARNTKLLRWLAGEIRSPIELIALWAMRASTRLIAADVRVTAN